MNDPYWQCTMDPTQHPGFQQQPVKTLQGLDMLGVSVVLWMQGFSGSMVLWFRGGCSSPKETEVERNH